MNKFYLYIFIFFFILGWDDEDVDDEFIKQLHHELQEFEKRQANKSN